MCLLGGFVGVLGCVVNVRPTAAAAASGNPRVCSQVDQGRTVVADPPLANYAPLLGRWSRGSSLLEPGRAPSPTGKGPAAHPSTGTPCVGDNF